MPKYNVHVNGEIEIDAKVEAESEDSARNKMRELLNDFHVYQCDIEVEEIKEYKCKTVKQEENSKEWEYPCLVIDGYETIVLAIGPGSSQDDDFFSGVIIKSKSYKIGTYSSSLYKLGCKLYKGEVTLRNSYMLRNN